MKKESPVWRHRPVEEGEVAALARDFDLAPVVAQILWRRGVEDVAGFLAPSLSRLPDPSLLLGLDAAVEVLVAAMAAGRPITVYADYDADGVTGAAVLANFLAAVDYPVRVVQPDRFRHGYGLHEELVRQIAGRGEGVLLTVDCGINDHAAVALARELGLTVIVSDHHLVPQEPVAAQVVINPRQEGCPFPDKDLAGVGVAFYLAMGLRRALRPKLGNIPNLRDFLDLVALGTVADMVALTGVNRILVKTGLAVLAEARRPGVRALLAVAGLDNGNPLTAEDIGFRLAPRLNAAGRLDEATVALELLRTQDHRRARELAGILDQHNEERKRLTEEITRQAMTQVDPEAPAVVAAGCGWHQGVVGIVASRLVDTYCRPAVVLALDEDQGGVARGSARSVPGFHLCEGLAACKDFLERFGGHAQAAGLALRQEMVDGFREAFCRVVAAAGLTTTPQVEVDVLTDGAGLTSPAFLRQYEQLAPFGNGNPEPLFGARECRLDRVQLLKDRHLRFGWQAPDGELPCIAFGQGHLASLVRQRPAAMLFHLRPNYWQGIKRWQVFVTDLTCEPTN